MTFNDDSHVGHAAVTNLHAVSVAYGAKFASRWEVFFNQPQKNFSDVSGDVAAKWGVEPGDVPFSLPLSAVFFRWLVL